MKRSIILIIGIISIISSFNVYSFLNEDNDLGEVIAVSADHIEPITVSSDYLKARNYPVIVFLRGFTLGSLLFGEDAPSVNPFFGGLNIRDFTVHFNEGSQYATFTKPILPKGNELRIGKNGEIDLGYMIVKLKRNPKEEDIPEQINLNLTAKFIFDSVSKFGIFGQQDLILTPMKEESFLSDPSSGGFWSNRGYIRLDNLDKDEARLELYDGSLKTISNFKMTEGKEKEYNLRGGPHFLDNKLRVKLRDILTPQTNAVLLIDNNYDFTRTTVISGMVPFVGSSWKVKEIIYPGIIKFINNDGEIVEISGTSSHTYDSCISETHIDERKDYLSQDLKSADVNKIKCTAISEYELALIYATPKTEKEYNINFKIARIYEELGALVKSLDYYNKIDKDSNYYNQKRIGDKISFLEKMIEDESPSIVLDDAVVFLEKIEEIESTSYFLAVKEGDEEKRFVIGQKLIEKPHGADYNWIVEDILEDKITLITAPRSAYDGTYILRKGANTVNGIEVYVNKINYEKAALISILPGSGRAYGSSEFMVNIPIEKRLITWTPEEIDKKIEKTSNTIEKMDKILEKLGNVIKLWKGTCFVTYSTLITLSRIVKFP